MAQLTAEQVVASVVNLLKDAGLIIPDRYEPAEGFTYEQLADELRRIVGDH